LRDTLFNLGVRNVKRGPWNMFAFDGAT
jgi:hypothetical protein